MKFTKRQVEILYYLNEYQETTVKQISQKIGVTSQTIKAELMALEEILKIYNVSIELQSGKGIKVYGSNNLQQLLKISETNLEFPIQNQIVLLLLLNKEFLVLQDIADQLFISKSQVEKLMPGIIKDYVDKILSVRHYGYKYNGTEMERRQLFVQLMAPYMEGIDIRERFEGFSDNYIDLRQYFKEEIVQKALAVLDYVVSFKTFVLTDQSIRQLFLYLIFTLHNNVRDQGIIMSQDFLRGIEVISNFETYRDIIEELDKELNLELRKAEQDYLAYIFVVLKKHKRLDRDEILAEMNGFITEVLEHIKKKLSIDLSGDRQLIEGLSYHIYTAILTNMVFKYTQDYGGMKDIKKQYPLGYEMATITSDLMRKALNYVMKDYEMVYLALHFQTSIEKQKKVEQRIRAIIVCHFGQAACQLISVKMERLYPEIDIVGTYSIQEFLELEERNYDLIITTEKLTSQEITTIYVTPALKETELGRIRDFIRTRNTGFMIQDQIRHAIILDIEEKCTREEVIAKMVNELEIVGGVTTDYLESVYQREQISSTSMQYIAVPHGNPEYVKETNLVIARLRHAVNWEEEEVGCVFLLTVTGELLNKNSRFFTTFYKKIAQLEFEAQLRELENHDSETFKEELIRLFE